MKTFLASVLVLITAAASAQEAASDKLPVTRCGQVNIETAGSIYDSIMKNKNAVEADIKAVKECNEGFEATASDNGDQAISLLQYRQAIMYCNRKDMIPEKDRARAQRLYQTSEFRAVRNLKNKENFMSAHLTNSVMSCEDSASIIYKLMILLNQ
jgi:hypothetical protein